MLSRRFHRFALGISGVFALLMLLGMVLPVLAQQSDLAGLEPVDQTIRLTSTDPRIIVGRIIQAALGLIGIISVVIILYGGFIWMTSGGDQEKINQAKKIMANWAIGLVIIFLSFAIVTFLLSLFGYDPNGIFNRKIPFTFGRGQLGNGIIESHYPPRGAHCLELPPGVAGCIARNTSIIVTFKEPIDIASIAGTEVIRPVWDPATSTMVDERVGYQLVTDSVRIFATNTDATDRGESTALAADAVIVNYTDNNRTFVFKPIEPIGSPSERMYYTVKLTNNVKRQNGESAFDDAGANSYYYWDFEVGTFLDLTPPKVQSVYPRAGKEEPRNVVVQINFNEAVDPTVTSTTSNVDSSGAVTFNNIVVAGVDDAGIETAVRGSFSIANEYRTVEFTSDDLCGVNSCGQDVFCLPGLSTIKVTVKSADLMPATSPTIPPGPAARFISGIGYNGVIDLATNSLNGNGENGLQCSVTAGANGMDCFRNVVKDGEHCSCTVGPDEDNYWWEFTTTNEIDLKPPHIINAAPAVLGTAAAEVEAPGWGLFSKVLMARSVVGGVSAVLSSIGNQVIVDGTAVDENLPYWPSLENYDSRDPSDPDEYPDNGTTLKLMHTGDPLQRAVIGQAPFNYSLHFTPGIRDIYQNCFFPSGASEGEVTVATGEGVGRACNYPDTGVGDTTPSCCNAEEYNDVAGESDRCPDPLSPLWPAIQ